MTAAFGRVAIIGASSGIGEEIARQLAAEGSTVALVARREAELERVAASIGADKARVYPHDVTRADDAPALFDRIVADLGGLDALVYAAGVMPAVEEHEYDFAKDRDIIAVNVLGAMAWMNPAAAYMEAQRAGTLVGISSIAGERGRRGFPAYSASKAAMTTYMEGLRNRLHRYGVSVCTVKPGTVRTPMTEGLDIPMPVTAQRAAELSIRLMKRSSASGFVPWRWTAIAAVIRNVPSFVFRKTNI